MHFTYCVLASLAVGAALSSHATFHALDHNHRVLHKRQTSAPPTTDCGYGETCEIACGIGFIQCGAASLNFCYNPSNGDTCCQPDVASNCKGSSMVQDLPMISADTSSKGLALLATIVLSMACAVPALSILPHAL
jgi:hypothetical protein